MKINIRTNWKEIIQKETKKEYWDNIYSFLNKEYSSKKIFPSKNNIFECFNYFDVEKTKVVIFGQDPYHNDNQANGLAFAVNQTTQTPPSLRNIFKELESDLKIRKTNSDLIDWAKQGVLLLNDSLTVEKNKPNSHSKIGWNIFTENIIKELQKRTKNVVYILWGSYSQKKEKIIDSNKNFLIKSAHPSPLSAHKGFFSSKPFSKTNEYLSSVRKKTINW